MTQTTPILFRVQGKDRMSDAWTTFAARFRWQVEKWAADRAFVGEITEVPVTSRARLDWMTGGAWEAYTAWEAPEVIYALIERVRHETVQRFRIVLEDEPGVLIGV